jgi:hypothetical protein
LRLLAALGVVCSLARAAGAQEPAFGRTASESQGTIASTGVWQRVLPAAGSATARSNCIIQDTGTHAMSIFFGPAAPATNATVGFPLAAATTSGSFNVGGGWITCGNMGGGLTNGPVWITGTSGDTFEYASQP